MSRGGDNRYYDNGNRHDSYRQNDRHREQYNSNEDRYHNHSNRYENSSRERDGSGFNGTSRNNYSNNHRYDDDELARNMRQMNVSGGVRGGGRGGQNIYSTYSSGGTGSRGFTGTLNDSTAPPGSARNLDGGIDKKQLPYNDQKFAERPEFMIQEKKLGEPVMLYTNHTLVHLPEKTMRVLQYNVDIFNNGKLVTKREEASVLFWEIYKKRRNMFPAIHAFIFNDVNILWVIESDKFRFSEGEIATAENPKRPKLYLKYSTSFEFGKDVDKMQESSLLSTLIDAIATQRSRKPTPSNCYTVFKRLTFLVQDKAVEKGLDGIALYHPFKFGTDARVGFSIAVRMNLRAGPTACFDINHTLFNRPGYPLVRLLVELCLNEVITDEEYEERYDQMIKDSQIDEANRATMHKILDKMTLHYQFETAMSVESARKMQDNVPAGRGAGSRFDKSFKYYNLGLPADRAFFEYQKDEYSQKREMSVAEYYKLEYGYALRYPHLPVVIKKPSAKQRNGMLVQYPMEFVSYVVNPTRYSGFTPESLRAEMVRETAYTPVQRLKLLQHVMEQKGIAGAQAPVDNDDPNMRAFGLSMEKTMLEVKGTVLPVPKLVYGNSAFLDSDHSGSWEAVRNEPIRTVLPESLYERKCIRGQQPRKKRLIGSIFLIESPNHNSGASLNYDTNCYNSLMSAIEKSGQPVKWLNEEEKQAAILHVYSYRQGVNQPGEILDQLRSVRDACASEVEGEVLVPIVFLIFRLRCSFLDNRSNFHNDYNMSKYLGDNVEGVYTQGMLVENFNQIKEDPKQCKITCHIVEKILGKVGTTHRKIERDRKTHRPWMVLTDPESPTLVLGIDVSHPQTKHRLETDSVNSLSVATVVGNIDLDVSQFRASSRIQDRGEEQIVRMEFEVQARIDDFIAHTGRRPKHIVVYRDGICEGDFQRILYEERIAIEEAYKKTNPKGELDVTLTYIVVSKRHHTKFFPKDLSKVHEEHMFNVKPGTLVEDVVTTEKYYDFYLTTQVGMLGTSRPTHYYVLHDTWAPMISFWPTITHALTYTFCRATTTIALPSPVIYAHLAAKRAKETLNAQSARDCLEGRDVDLESTAEIARLTKAINVNTRIDGMTFV